jgi:hypothetical protein
MRIGRSSFLAVALTLVGATLSVTLVAAPAAADPQSPCEIEAPENCPGPGGGNGWMEPTTPPPPPNPTPIPPPPAEAGLDCGEVTNAVQLVVIPGNFKAFNYFLTVHYCFNSQRDIVKAIPVSFGAENLWQSEVDNNLPSGSLGRILITRSDRTGPVIRLNIDPPINTFSGDNYNGEVIFEFRYTPNGGAPQDYRARARVAIDFFGPRTFTPMLDRI